MGSIQARREITQVAIDYVDGMKTRIDLVQAVQDYRNELAKEASARMKREEEERKKKRANQKEQGTVEEQAVTHDPRSAQGDGL